MPIESLADRRSLLADDGVLALLASFVGELPEGAPASIEVDRNVVGLFDRSYQADNNISGYQPVLFLFVIDARKL